MRAWCRRYGDIMPDKDTDFYISELMSEQCQCGRHKKIRFSFCWPCYNTLPGYLQSGLYQDMGKGYEEAYEEAVEWLGEQ
jgi:hypothetical protein